MRRKQIGFTLVELLAIIVILAIIAIITVPLILNIINSAKEGAVKNSAKGYIDAVKKQIVINKMDDNPANDINDGTKSVLELSNDYSVIVEGQMPTGNSTVTFQNGVITMYELNFGGYLVKFINGVISAVKMSNYVSVDELIIPDSLVVDVSQTVEINASVNPSNASIKTLIYSSSNKEIATVDEDGVVTGVSVGSASITVASADNILITRTIPITVSPYDVTPPTSADFTYSVSSDSITVTASGNDDETGISYYQFSNDDGESWFPSIPQESNVYTFDNNILSGSNYLVRVRVLNGKYIDTITNLNSLISDSKNVMTLDVTAPTVADFTYTATSNSIAVTASGVDSESGIVYYQFSKDDGVTFEPEIPQTDNAYTFANLSRGVNYSVKVKAINGMYNIDQSVNENNSKNSDSKIITLYDFGDSVSFAGYNWYVINTSSDTLTLFMDKNSSDFLTQFGFSTNTMEQCTNDFNNSTDCENASYESTYNGNYNYIYRWGKSKIQIFLNTTFYNSLSDSDRNRIRPVTVCNDPALYTSAFGYGGYLNSEISLINQQGGSASCSNLADYNIRLLSISEYYNLVVGVSSLYKGKVGSYSTASNGNTGYIPKINTISLSGPLRITLFNTDSSGFWLMTAYYSSYGGFTREAYYSRYINSEYNLLTDFASYSKKVRPVITISR